MLAILLLVLVLTAVAAGWQWTLCLGHACCWHARLQNHAVLQREHAFKSFSLPHARQGASSGAVPPVLRTRRVVVCVEHRVVVRDA